MCHNHGSVYGATPQKTETDCASGLRSPPNGHAPAVADRTHVAGYFARDGEERPERA
jgi:hypothetical protein